MATLTEEQRAKSLQGKRKKNGKAPKVALRNPFPKYWPLIDEVNATEIETLLITLLPEKREKVKIPWKKLVKLPKTVRKEKIDEISKNTSVSPELQLQRKCFKFGLNAVSRAIQHSQVNSCLLAGDVEPEIVIKHLVTLAVTRSIPVLIIPKLKSISSKKIGFPCVAIGIVVDKETPYLRPLHESIVRMSAKFPLPPNHGSFLRRTENDFVKLIRPYPKPISSPLESTNTDSSTQAIVPSTSTPSEVEANDFAGDFIKLDEEIDPEEIVSKRPRIDISSYIPPVFKRVPRNPNKIKKKKKKP